VARVPVAGSEPAVHGDFELPGVAGTGARIPLDFLEPGGAGTGRLLPTGKPREMVEGVEASLVDASIPMVFVRARDLGLTGTETPQAIDGDKALGARLEKIRVAASVLMGIPGSAATPKVAMVTAPVEYTALDGTRVDSEQADVVGRAISMGNCHRAFPLTSSMCLAVAARIEGTLVHECSTAKPGADVRLGHPSGVLPLDAAVVKQAGEYHAERVTVYRTARRLMEGWVRIP
jgi:2-methylaconitate cis-trans-isomerase PrpF